MRAVIIGPGRIGCGFAGQILHAAGYELTLVTRKPELASHFNRTGGYRVRLTGGSHPREVLVSGIRALWNGDSERVAEGIAQADLVVTAVGPRNLPEVAPMLAAGLARATSAINVLACENLVNAGPYLRDLVRSTLPDGTAARHGFSGALVIRVVSHRLGDPCGDEPLTFVGDWPEQCIVHWPGLRGKLPPIPGLIAVDEYTPWALRKLYTFSAGHATTAYLGALKGYHYIHSAIRDPEIRAAVLAAMREGQRGLAACFGPEVGGSKEDLEAIVRRFENAALNDPIVRVGRDPRRKLGAEERLVGAARLAAKAGVSPQKLSLASAAALCFFDPHDPCRISLPRMVETSGLASTLKEVCGLDATRGVGRNIADSWRQLAPRPQTGNLLLSLDHPMWACA